MSPGLAGQIVVAITDYKEYSRDGTLVKVDRHGFVKAKLLCEKPTKKECIEFVLSLENLPDGSN